MDEGDVLIKVDYSCLNYKDGLAITNSAPVVRRFPMILGIDCAGLVIDSGVSDYVSGDKVIVNGWGLGETHSGGLSEIVRVPSSYVTRMPDNLNARESMIFGTAGYTAALAINKLRSFDVIPESGEILVTGASGGLGSVAIPLLKKMEYSVVAVSGKSGIEDYLINLGASEVISRDDFMLVGNGKPLMKERFAGVIDTVGSKILANSIAMVKRGGVVMSCGLAGGMDLNTTVMPFILRGVTLAGVDSVYASCSLRKKAWQLLANFFDPDIFQEVVEEISLGKVMENAERFIDGTVKGRIVVSIS